LIRVSTGEFWNGMMHELIDRGHTYAFLYFFTFLILAQFIMLNLVVAVLLINYDDQQQKDREEAEAAATRELTEMRDANGALNSTGTVADKYTVSAITGDGDKVGKDEGGIADEESAVSTDPSQQPSESPSDPEAPGSVPRGGSSAEEEGP